jgi:ribose transport system permease protein
MTGTRRQSRKAASAFSRFLAGYGMLGVLLLLCLLFSLLTMGEQHHTGTSAADVIFADLAEKAKGGNAGVLIVARSGEDDLRFARHLADRLAEGGYTTAGVITGDPAAVRKEIENIAAARERGEAPKEIVIATLEDYASVVRSVLSSFPVLADIPIRTPRSYRWPTFLLADNLINVANQITVIAILAVGMTMVIIAGGIDLSVGSLIALSAVVATGLVGRLGGYQATAPAMFAACLGAIALTSLIGAFSGVVITRFDVPPFIATLGMMQVASGLAYILSRGKPIYGVPEGFAALGRGADPAFGIPYAVMLMGVLYVAAHLLMSHTTVGRYIYAVGGNPEAARLAGVRVKSVVMFVFIACGTLAGLGGVVMASQLKSGAPTYGLMYELYVIAAVVVGGTSLSGGEGRVFGTLIGAFIIAVIQNGMNLTNVESYTQKVVLGLVILGAVLLDRLRHRGWFWRRKRPRTGD